MYPLWRAFSKRRLGVDGRPKRREKDVISNENVLVWTRPEDLVPTTNERLYSCPLPTCTFSTGTYGPLQRYMADLFCQPEDTKELVDVVLTSTCDKSGVKELSYIKK